MSIELSSSSVPTANSPAKAEVFFNSHSTSNLSHSFTVNYEPYYIEAYNLGSTDIVTVQMVTASPGGPQYAEYIPFFAPIQLTNTRTKIRIDQPGVYNLLYAGPSVTMITVLGFPATMTHESTTEFAEALDAVKYVVANPTVVLGDSPITVTGSGTILFPYHVGINPATQITYVNGTNPIVVSGNGTLGTPFIISFNGTTQTTFVNGTSPITVTGNGTNGNPFVIGFSSTVQTSFATGTAPITVTGVGTSGNPFVVAATLATNSEEEAGSPANHLISAGVLKHMTNAATGAGAFLGIGTTTGVGSVSLGNSTISGPSAIALGDQANALTTGNISIGYQATTNHFATVAIGYQASCLGTSCVMIGPFSGTGSTIVSNSLVIGDGAVGGANFDGIALGSNVAINSLSDNCIAIGRSAGAKNRNDECIFVGTLAGANNLGLPVDTMSKTVAIGNAAAYSGNAVSVANFNNGIYIGNQAGHGETHSNNIIIGSHNTALNATADNQIILGNSTQTQLVTAGSVIAGGAIGPSDHRLKRNISSYVDGLTTITKIKPISFMWDEFKLDEAKIPHLKTDLPYQQYGVIAQDVQKILPNTVEKYGDGDHLFVHYDRFIPHLISAVQELNHEVTLLKAKINQGV